MEVAEHYGFLEEDNPHDQSSIPPGVLLEALQRLQGPEAEAEGRGGPLREQDCWLHPGGVPCWALLSWLRRRACSTRDFALSGHRALEGTFPLRPSPSSSSSQFLLVIVGINVIIIVTIINVSIIIIIFGLLSFVKKGACFCILRTAFDVLHCQCSWQLTIVLMQNFCLSVFHSAVVWPPGDRKLVCKGARAGS